MYTKLTVISQGRETRVEQVALISFISIEFILSMGKPYSSVNFSVRDVRTIQQQCGANCILQ